MVDQALEIYKNKRSHWSLNLKTPGFAHIDQQHDYVPYKRAVDKRVNGNKFFKTTKEKF